MILIAKLALINKKKENALLKGVKVYTPRIPMADGDSIRSFIIALKNYFDLMQLISKNQQARFAETLLIDNSTTWFLI